MKIRLITVLFLFLCVTGAAQVEGQMQQLGPPGSQINQQQENEDSVYVTTPRESYSLKRYFKSLAGKDSMNITRMWAGSLVLPGSAQLYNKQYWKIPLVYASIGGFAYTGYQNNLKWLETRESKYKTTRDLCYLGAAISYWGSVIDGISNYKYHKEVLPPRASLLSTMIPGLGQIHNGDYWKVPIFYGGFIITGYFITSNNDQFNRYKYMYYETSDPESPLYQKYNPETMRYYKDSYRRFRDYSIIAGILVYALNIIDANVFAHLKDFDVSDDLSVQIDPEILLPLNPKYAMGVNPGVGFRLNLNF